VNAKGLSFKTQQNFLNLKLLQSTFFDGKDEKYIFAFV